MHHIVIPQHLIRERSEEVMDAEVHVVGKHTRHGHVDEVPGVELDGVVALGGEEGGELAEPYAVEDGVS